MGDRENLSIPVNLAFLAGLLVVSHLLTVVAPVRTVDAKLPDPPSADLVLPAPKPALDRPGPEATMTLAAVTMPKLPTVAMPEATAPKPVSDLARPTADSPGPTPDIMPAPDSSQARSERAASKQIKPISPTGRPKAAAPELVPIKQAAGVVPQRNAGSSVPQIPALEPMTAERQQTPDVMSQRRLTRLLAPGPQDDDGPVSTTARPATPAMSVEATRPRASDFQTANLLMDDAAQKLSLEFLWPSDRHSHALIYSRLTECLGVEAGVIDGTGTLYVGTAGGRGFNGALHSPFMRLVDQPVDPRELRTIESIRNGRRLTHDGRPVRVFRRDHDIRLLAALNRAFGGLPKDGRVTAEYRMEAGLLYLAELTLDGRHHAGRVRLDHDSCI